MLGTFAARHLGGFTAGQLRAYEGVVNLQTIDLFRLLTRQCGGSAEELGLPADADTAAVLAAIQAFITDNPLAAGARASPAAAAAAYADVKAGMSN